MKYLLPLTFTIAVLFTGCAKEKTQSIHDVFTDHSWVIQSETDNGLAVTIPVCQKDDVIAFKANNTGVQTNGTMVCVAGEAASYPFTYSLSADNSTLIYNTFGGVAGVNVTMHIVRVDNSGFEVIFSIGTHTYDNVYVVKQ